MANRLDTFVTLTYQTQPDPTECAPLLTNFFRRVCRKGGAAWLAVTERGTINEGIHHHALISGGVTPALVQSKWPHGLAEATRLGGHEDIRRTVHYMSKSFWLPAEARLGKCRYQRSRSGIRPKRVRLYMTERELQQYLRDQRIDNVEWRFYDNPEHRLRKTGTWDPY